MINPNELRVGNYVYDDTNTIVKIEKIHSERHVIWSESEYFDFSKSNDKENMYSSIVNPIPLTESMALKLDFCKDNSENNKTYLSPMFNGNTIKIYFNRFGTATFLINIHFRIELRYVHQVQNLFLSLFGEELVFSSTEP